jgi:hypothetical protein
MIVPPALWTSRAGDALPTGPAPHSQHETPMPVEIYALSDPRDGQTRYIGKANNAKARLKSHFRDCKRRNTPVYAWIGGLLAEGLRPSMTVIAACTSTDWEETEIRLIAEAKAIGITLLNVARGGNEPFCSKATRAANGKRNAIARTEDPRMAEIYRIKQKLGVALKRGYVREDTKAKLRAAAIECPELFSCWANV